MYDMCEPTASAPARARAAGRTSGRAAATKRLVEASARVLEHPRELAQRDALLVLVPLDWLGDARELGLELLARRDQLEPVGVEAPRLPRPGCRRAPRGRRTRAAPRASPARVRSGISSPLNVTRAASTGSRARRSARRARSRSDPPRTSCAGGTGARARRRSAALLGLAQRLELRAAEQVGVAVDDLRLLGRLLLPHPHGAPLLGALEHVAARGGSRTRLACGRR